MIPNDSELRDLSEKLECYENAKPDETVKLFKIDLDMLLNLTEALLETPEGWPEKRIPPQDLYDCGFNKCVALYNKARLKEKQAEVPTVEEINEVFKTEGLCGTKTAKAVHKLIKSKQRN